MISEKSSHKNHSLDKSVPQTLNLQIKNAQYTCDHRAITLNVTQNKKEVNFIMDTGASINLIKLEDIPDNIHVLPFKQKVRAAGIYNIDVVGKLYLNFFLKEQKFTTCALAVNGIKENLLGMDFMNNFVENINFQLGFIKFKNSLIMEIFRPNAKYSKAYTINNFICPPMSSKNINITVPNFQNKLILAIQNKSSSYDFATETLTKCDENGMASIAINNYSDKPMYFNKNSVIASVQQYNNDLSLYNISAKSKLIDINAIPDKISKTTGLSKHQQNKLNSLLNEFDGIFSKYKGEIGKHQSVKHKINLKENKPFKFQPRSTTHEKRQIIEQEIDKMLKSGLIQPSQSEYGSPIVLVKKPDNSTRFCIDYRKLNSMTKSDAFPMPDIDQCLESLSGASYFSTMDFTAAFHQIPMDESSIEYTAFTSHVGLFEFLGMPFGLRNASATQQRMLVNEFRNHLFKFILIYIDDLLAYSKDFDSHLKHLRIIFEIIQKAGLKLNRNKCKFALTEINFLGHTIKDNEILPLASNVNKIKNIQPPKDKKELQRFIGLTSYYRKWIKNFSDIASPLLDLLKQSKKYIWQESHQNAYDSLKNKLVSYPILQLPNFELPFILYTDASDKAIGAVLSQHPPKNISEHVVCYASRKLSPTEQNYCATDRELLAVVWAVEYFNKYLDGNKFKIVTDHCPIKYIKDMKPEKLKAKHYRYLMILENYDYDIQYKTGVTHQNADYMSRNCAIADNIDINMIEISQQDVSCDENIAFQQEKWKDLQDIIRNNKNANNILYRKLQHIELLKKAHNNIWTYDDKILVPPKLRYKIISLAHDSMLHAHMGVRKTYSFIKSIYYWPGIKKDTSHYVLSCESCQKRYHGKNPKDEMQIFIPSYPFQRIGMDFQGPYNMSKSKNRYILILTDYFTKWPLAYATKDMTAQTVAKIITQKVIPMFGTPKIIHTDQGRQFESNLLKELFKLLNIKHTRTSPYHPESDGQAERTFKTIRERLSKSITSNSVDWDEYLDQMLFGLRCTINDTTGFTPAELMFGRNIVSPHELLFGFAENTPLLAHEFYQNLKKNQHINFKNAIKNYTSAKVIQ